MLRKAALLGALALSVALFFPTPDFSALPEPIRPYRPRLLAFVNSLPWLASLISFDPDFLIQINTWRTGLYNLDDEDGTFKTGLKLLTKSLDEESELTVFGRIFTHIQLDMWIGHRLGLAALDKQTVLPEIRRPIFVVGMPRSGTTFLHNLLSLDTENFRAPRNWEIITPLPPLPYFQDEEPWSLTAQWRFWYAKVQIEFFRIIASKVAAVHPISPLNAEECMPLLALSMISLQFNTLSNVSSYNSWMLDQDPRKALKWHKIFLQALRSGTPVNKLHPNFLLKAPWHLNHLDAIFKTYPDAVIINPHRSPMDMLASLSSLHARFYGIVSDAIHPEAIGRYQLAQWKIIIRRYLNARKSLTRDQARNVFDYSFEAVTSRPMDTVQDIYRRMGLVLTPKVEAKMRTWLEKDVVLGKKGAAGEHVYQASWFGLDAKVVDSEFVEYTEKYLGLS